MSRYLIVGLGNPGLDYEKTKHNVGFMCIDKLLQSQMLFLNNNKFSGQYTIVNQQEDQVFIAKPLTYMNNSGQFVYELCKFYKIYSQNILVIYDDIDTDVGKIRIRSKGSSGGQNGMKNIIKCMGTENIKRIRIGIGKPNNNLVHHVLTKFNKQDLEKVEIAIENAKTACLDFMSHTNFDNIMNKFNV
ncbi:MAG: aminoacyl-tRNA hydrolase [Malacoplasma sp.]|nr:aminoacyl-tRNA hydrolase [Malacoplasma sp.]